MPTINKTFLLRMILVVAGFAGMLYGAHAYQARRIPDALKRQADRATEANKLDQAVHYLRQYIEFRPDDADAQEQLATLLRRRDPGPRGYLELVFLYDRILRIDPERHHVRRDSLTLCLKIGRYSDAVTHSETLLKSFATDGALWQQLGTAHLGLNQLADAQRSYETALTYAPTDLMCYQRLAQLFWRNMDKPAEARAVLDRMVAAMPQEPEAFLIRARFEKFVTEEESGRARGVGDVNRAIKDLHRVLELDPENADASLMLAEILQRGRDVPAAHAILKDVVAIYPKDLRLVRSLAWLELVRGNIPAAIAVLEDGLKATPDGFDLLVPLADLMVQQGDTTRSAEILGRLEARKAPPIQVKYLKARVAMREARWSDAITLLESLRAETLNLPALEAQLNLLLANCAQNTANSEAEEKAYKRVTGADGGNVAARVGLPNLYVNLGRFDEALREYEASARSPYAPGSVVAQWVRLKARRLKLTGGSATEWEKLEQAVKTATPRFGPVSSEAVILLGELAVTQGKPKEAIKSLREETARRPGDTRLWAALAEVSADAGGTPAGLAVVDEAQAAAGDSADIRLIRAALYAREPGRIRPIDPLAERIDSWSEAEQSRLLHGLIEIYDSLGEQAKVIQVLKRIAARRPTDLATWMRLHERAVAANDANTAMQARTAIVRIDGETGPSVAVCDASRASTAIDPKPIEALIAKVGASPNRADACLVLARFKAAAGDQTEALRLSERAFLLEPTRYETARVLVLALCNSGNDDRAANLIRRFAADSRWAGEPFRRMIDGALSQLPQPLALKLIGWCDPIVSNEPDGFGWLAAAYSRMVQADRGMQLLETAVHRPGATCDDWCRLALVRDTGTVMKHAAEALPQKDFLALAAVIVETPQGKNWAPELNEPRARRLYVQARIAVKLSRSEPLEAANLLEVFIAEKDVAKEDLGWAKRNLAMLYAVGGKPEDRQRAIDLIKTSDDVGTTPEEMRATAGVLTTLARYLEGEDRKLVLNRAAAVLNLAHQASNSHRDLFHLAQIYRAAGNRIESRRCLNALLQADQNNIYYLTSALEELTEDGNIAAAEAFAERLRKNYAGEFRAVSMVARFECKAGRPERALAVAEGYTRAADLSAGDYLARSARVAELLDELSRMPKVRGTPTGRRMVDAAIERYAALVPTRAESAVAIAGLLASDGRITEAFARIETYDRYETKRIRALAGLAAVRSGGASERQFNIVKGWLDTCLGEDPDSITLRLNEAELRAIRQDLEGAIAVYESVLKLDPRNVVALNNLAWLLATDPKSAGRALELIDRATREAGLSGEMLDTRARVRITLRQFDRAEHDLTEALSREVTPLRYFHIAVLRLAQSPARPEDAAKAFQEAKARGLDVANIHPTDLPVYKVLDAGSK